MAETRRVVPSIAMVVRVVAGELGVDAAEIISAERGRRRVVLARQVAAYLCAVSLARASATRLAPAFRRHRSTIDHALRAIEDRRDDPTFDERLCRLEERLAGG